MANKIFISYRRDDSAGTAGRLHDRLAERFGQKNLFFDVDNVPAGTDFVEYLGEQVASCDIFLCAIGPHWLDNKDDGGRRRLDQPDDFVRVEIGSALKRKIPVIPVLIDGARVPKTTELPEDIAALARRQAVEVRNSYFRRDADGLSQRIREILKQKRSTPSRVVFAAILGSVALFIFGAIGLYQTGIVSLPWLHSGATAQLPNPTKEAAISLPATPDAPSTNQTSAMVAPTKSAESPGSGATAQLPNPTKEAAISLPATPNASSTNQTSAMAAPTKPAESPATGSPLDMITDCDRLATSSADSQRPKAVPGVSLEEINVASALAACNEAVRKYPDIARFSYDLGRVDEAAKDYSAARKQYDRAADLGSSIAMFNIGILYEKGRGVAQDFAEAKRWYEKAAAAGNPGAMTAIGYLYDAGLGVRQDYSEAKRLYEKAAASGDPSAMYNIGLLYSLGQGVRVDYTEAKSWYEKAAAVGHPNAINTIGALYEKGQGVPRDYAEAKRWYEKSAAAGNATAMFNIGVLYEKGRGVPQDFSEAKRWYEKAAASGYSQAALYIGDFYITGKGVTKNIADARTWYQKAAAAGNVDAKKRLAALPSK
jgi:TPR repeat protein